MEDPWGLVLSKGLLQVDLYASTTTVSDRTQNKEMTVMALLKKLHTFVMNSKDVRFHITTLDGLDECEVGGCIEL